MITKYIKYGALALAVLFCSCDKWLTVEPDYQVTDTDLFKNAEGYHKALNGIYLTLSGNGMYGKELSWGAVEAWARVYALSNSQTNYVSLRDLKYDEKGPEDYATTFWQTGYKMIAQTNDLLAHLQEVGADMFYYKEREKNMIEGEALALRAMIHFDLLRLFASAPALNDAKAYIPYVETYPSKFNPPVSTQQVLAKAIADLEKAKGLLATYDLGSKTDSTKLTNADSRFLTDKSDFYSNRGIRLNYLAVTGLLARVSLYAGDRDKALENASLIIDYVTAKAIKLDNSNPFDNDPRMRADILFAFYNPDLADTYSTYSKEGNAVTTYLVLDSPTLFTGNNYDKRKAFVRQVTNQQGSKTPVLSKYIGTDGVFRDGLVPNIRISEMYYIAAECTYETDMKTAVGYLNTVRKARMTSGYTLNTSMGTDEFLSNLTAEYRKDLIGEGQMLFYFKRRNIPIVYSGSDTGFIHNGNLKLNIPDSESAI